MAARPFEGMVAIGRVVKPQGRKGEVAVEAFSDRPDRFPSLKTVHVAGDAGAARPLEVESVWPHKGRFVLKLRGIDSIDAAETLRGLEVRIGEEELAALPAGSYYHHQLKGLAAVDEDGGALGTVHDVLETGGEAPVLSIRHLGAETLVPLAESFVRSVDLERGRIVIARPQYAEAGR
jgi:16S rRNA processing protein RimM